MIVMVFDPSLIDVWHHARSLVSSKLFLVVDAHFGLGLIDSATE